MSDYESVVRLIRLSRACVGPLPDASELARLAGMSLAELRWLLSRWAGMSPQRFLQVVALGRGRQPLRSGAAVWEVARASGRLGPGRRDDVRVRFDVTLPGEPKRDGGGWQIAYGVVDSPFGPCLIAGGPRGICHLGFPGEESDSLARIQADWPGACLQKAEERAAEWAAEIFVPGAVPGATGGWQAWVRGSAFQVRVWRALLAVPPGQAVSYGRLAKAIGQSGAARAVGGAVGANPLACLIPCHRVFREDGGLGGYHWGVDRKLALLVFEQAVSRPEVRTAGCGASA